MVLGLSYLEVRDAKEGWREQSDFNLTEFDWSVLHVSTFGLGI